MYINISVSTYSLINIISSGIFIIQVGLNCSPAPGFQVFYVQFGVSFTDTVPMYLLSDADTDTGLVYLLSDTDTGLMYLLSVNTSQVRSA